MILRRHPGAPLLATEAELGLVSGHRDVHSGLASGTQGSSRLLNLMLLVLGWTLTPVWEGWRQRPLAPRRVRSSSRPEVTSAEGQQLVWSGLVRGQHSLSAPTAVVPMG